MSSTSSIAVFKEDAWPSCQRCGELVPARLDSRRRGRGHVPERRRACAGCGLLICRRCVGDASEPGGVHCATCAPPSGQASPPEKTLDTAGLGGVS